MRTVRLGRENRVAHAHLGADQASPVRKVGDAELLGALQQVREIEIDDVIADQQIRVAPAKKITPVPKQFPLILKTQDVSADDRSARIERPHGSNNRFIAPLLGD